jgi:hypothetical protein
MSIVHRNVNVYSCRKMRLEVVKDETTQHKFTALQGTTSHMAYHVAVA